MEKKGDKIAWLAVLQGFSMLLVVLGHVTLTNEFMDPHYPVVRAMERVIYTFHMPLFIFISGWLFCLTCLNRNKTYRETMRKKLFRLGIPFITFTLITTVVKLLLSHFVRRPVDANELIKTFLLFSSNPLGEMWFIIVLLILMAIYPVYQMLLRNDALIWGFCGSLMLFAVLPENIEYFQISRVIRLSVYFIFGIICCHYRVVERFASRWYVLAGSLALFICINVLELSNHIAPKGFTYVIGCLAGITLSVNLCCLLSSVRPSAFSSFRNYTFQIFLLGIFFQMAVRIIYGRTSSIGNWVYPLLFIMSVLLGIYVPVAISRLIENKLPALCTILGLRSNPGLK